MSLTIGGGVEPVNYRPLLVETSWLPYFAGVVDARGHIELNSRHGHPQPRVRVTTRRRELLEWLAARTGTTVVEDSRGYNRKLCGEHCSEQHVHVARQSAQWTVDSSRATVVLYAIQPYVIAQAAEVRRALLSGLERFPPAHGDVPRQMAGLGWPLPEVAQPAPQRAGDSPL